MKTQLYKISFVLFFLIPIFSFAQEPEIEWGGPVLLKEKVFEILGENSTGIYSVGGKGKKYFLESFDSETYSKNFSKEIIVKEEGGLKTRLAKMLLMEENIIQLTYNVNKASKELNVFGYLLDKNGKVTSGRKDIINASFEKKSRSGYQDIRTSRDGSKLLVCNSAYFKKGSDFYQVDLTLYSSDLEPIIKTTTKVPVGEKTDISVSNFYVSNDGGFFMALTERDREKGVYVTKKFDVYSYQPYNGFQPEKIEIDLQDKMATSIALTSDSDGNLIGAGFYGEKYNAGIFKGLGLAGSYFIKIDPKDGTILNSTMKEFSSDFTGRVLKEKKANKGKLIPNYFQPLEIIAKSDGGAVMISEYQQTVFNREARITTYIHGPLAVVDIMPDGNINWVKPISKNQIYNEKQLTIGVGGFFGGISLVFAYSFTLFESQTVYHSALFGVRDDKLFVMYNDNPKNQEIEHYRDTKKLVGYTKSVPVVVEIDGNGSMRKSLLEGGKSQVVLRPGVSFQAKQGETIIYGTRRKEEKVGRLTY